MGRVFREEENDNEDRDDEHEEDVVTWSMFETLWYGQAVVAVVHGSPQAPIVGDDCNEGQRGGSVADETITDGVKTMATTERGMRW